MSKSLLHISTQDMPEEKAEKLYEAIDMILSSPAGDQVKIAAFEALAKSYVSVTNISNCNFSGFNAKK